MNIGLYQSASSLSALERWQDVVAQNISSAQSTGYRKRTVEFTTEEAGERLIDPNARVGSDAGLPALFPKATTGINFLGGETIPTHRDLDVAISGEGFFEVQMADGSHAYTRNGEFHLKPDGTIVSSGGHEVLSDAGSPFTLLPGQGSLNINADGSVYQGNTLLGRLSVQKFENPSALVPADGGLFFNAPGANPSSVDNPDLMQGYIENSNVQPLREMVDLVLISRAYEANQRIITTADQQMQKTLEALG
ncbi:MAG TPA: flagellar hook-basal body protein [Candidatus Didemnitutus sp.]|nr:flagellar hook-basal body protein [Candidatus Didemnitutus sp.]